MPDFRTIMNLSVRQFFQLISRLTPTTPRFKRCEMNRRARIGAFTQSYYLASTTSDRRSRGFSSKVYLSCGGGHCKSALLNSNLPVSAKAGQNLHCRATAFHTPLYIQTRCRYAQEEAVFGQHFRRSLRFWSQTFSHMLPRFIFLPASIQGQRFWLSSTPFSCLSSPAIERFTP